MSYVLSTYYVPDTSMCFRSSISFSLFFFFFPLSIDYTNSHFSDCLLCAHIVTPFISCHLHCIPESQLREKETEAQVFQNLFIYGVFLVAQQVKNPTQSP